MTMVDPVLVASQFDEDEAEAILRYNIRKYLKANRVSQNSLMDVLNITSVDNTPALLFLQIGVSSRMFALQLVFRRASARNAQ